MAMSQEKKTEMKMRRARRADLIALALDAGLPVPASSLELLRSHQLDLPVESPRRRRVANAELVNE
jgi:hypothetical protein